MAIPRCLLDILVLSSALAVSFRVATAADTEPPITAPIGVARIDITPDTPIRMYGYASRKTESEGVAGPLSAKALAIGSSDGHGPAVLLAVDCGAVPGDIRDLVYQRINEKTPIAAERFVLCNSHCHSGPNLKGMHSIEGEEHEHLTRYAEQLTDRLVRVVEQALENRQPARLELARGKVTFAANRRVLTDGKWSGFGAVLDAPVDHELAVLKVTREDGKVLAVLANYACHNTTLRGNFSQIHGDWAACAQQYIEADQPGTIALISIGCGADSDPSPHGTVELCERHGRALADEVDRLLTGPWIPITPTIAAQQRILEISWQQNPDTDAAGQAAETSGNLNSPVGKPDERVISKAPKLRTYPIVTWTFADDLAMVFLSNEVVVDYAIRLKQEFDPDRLWVTAYANDVTAYVVSPRLIEEGGYESNNSLSSHVTSGQPEKLDPPMLERVVGMVKEMLPETFRKP
ncbi:MAG: neutral/alkaline non-lysosomal ceramidase N-terminal domain-containing protein [Pirellulaceae bacterium]